MSKFKVTVTNDGEVLDEFSIDGYDMTNPAYRAFVGEQVQDAMGGIAVAECRLQPQEDPEA